MDISIEIVYGYTMDLVGNCKFQSMDFTYFSQCLLLYARELYIKRSDLQSHLTNAKFVFWQLNFLGGKHFSHMMRLLQSIIITQNQIM